MRPARPKPRSAKARAAADIDARYGLEPVIDLQAEAAAAAATGFVTVRCPYCGEAFDTRVDLTSGSASYVEDCQICCQPIEMVLSVADDGTLAQFSARRLDQ
ncbi:MAG: CPXCG motif-containing cysteine-rich protein [Steroidobacteraceae bacterium]